MDIDSEATVLVVRNDFEHFIPKTSEKRAAFARYLADVVGETDVTTIRRRDIPSQRSGSSSTQSAPNRRRKGR